MLLVDYLKEIDLPNPALKPYGKITSVFFKKQILTLYNAIQYVYELPYGRTRNRENYLQVLEEEKGTCSTKHALIAALSKELFVPLKLFLGIFFLTKKNTPKIAAILEHYHLKVIPEAHCYLTYNNNVLDITFPHSSEFSLRAIPEQIFNITPQQIGDVKLEKHKAFIKAWLKGQPDLSFDLIWRAREQSIQALGQ